jgi:hypothetical protein
MYAASEDCEGNDQYLVLDGKKCSEIYKEILWTENIFSSDSKHFAYTNSSDSFHAAIAPRFKIG